MQRLAGLTRCNMAFIEARVRGPKKKGQVEAKIQSNDIINIFKDRKDPEPRDITTYPIFVQQMSMGMTSIHELLIANQHNIKYDMPSKPLYKSYIRGLKRQRYKSIREFKQLDQLRIDKLENFQIHDRTSIYDLFGKTKQEQEEQLKAALAAQAAEEDDDEL